MSIDLDTTLPASTAKTGQDSWKSWCSHESLLLSMLILLFPIGNSILPGSADLTMGARSCNTKHEPLAMVNQRIFFRCRTANRDSASSMNVPFSQKSQVIPPSNVLDMIREA